MEIESCSDSQLSLESTQASTHFKSSIISSLSQLNNQSVQSQQYEELKEVLKGVDFEETDCFYYVDKLNDPERNAEIFLYEKIGESAAITGIKGKDLPLTEGLSEFLKHCKELKPVLLGVSLFKGGMPNSSPFGTNLMKVKHELVANQPGSSSKKALFFCGYHSYKTSSSNSNHTRVVAKVIITGQREMIDYLTSKGFPQLDWEDNALLKANEKGLLVRKNYTGSESLHINVIHVGLVNLTENPSSMTITQAWPTISTQ